jgi:hypothetical protein
MLNFFKAAKKSGAAPNYSSSDFIFRLKKLEKICAKEGLDGFIVATGIDTRDNEEYVKLINWLFLGICVFLLTIMMMYVYVA